MTGVVGDQPDASAAIDDEFGPFDNGACDNRDFGEEFGDNCSFGGWDDAGSTNFGTQPADPEATGAESDSFGGFGDGNSTHSGAANTEWGNGDFQGDDSSNPFGEEFGGVEDFEGPTTTKVVPPNGHKEANAQPVRTNDSEALGAPPPDSKNSIAPFDNAVAATAPLVTTATDASESYFSAKTTQSGFPTPEKPSAATLSEAQEDPKTSSGLEPEDEDEATTIRLLQKTSPTTVTDLTMKEPRHELATTKADDPPIEQAMPKHKERTKQDARISEENTAPATLVAPQLSPPEKSQRDENDLTHMGSVSEVHSTATSATMKAMNTSASQPNSSANDFRAQEEQDKPESGQPKTLQGVLDTTETSLQTTDFPVAAKEDGIELSGPKEAVAMPSRLSQHTNQEGAPAALSQQHEESTPVSFSLHSPKPQQQQQSQSSSKLVNQKTRKASNVPNGSRPSALGQGPRPTSLEENCNSEENSTWKTSGFNPSSHVPTCHYTATKSVPPRKAPQANQLLCDASEQGPTTTALRPYSSIGGNALSRMQPEKPSQRISNVVHKNRDSENVLSSSQRISNVVHKKRLAESVLAAAQKTREFSFPTTSKKQLGSRLYAASSQGGMSIRKHTAVSRNATLDATPATMNNVSKQAITHQAAGSHERRDEVSTHPQERHQAKAYQQLAGTNLASAKELNPRLPKHSFIPTQQQPSVTVWQAGSSLKQAPVQQAATMSASTMASTLQQRQTPDHRQLVTGGRKQAGVNSNTLSSSNAAVSKMYESPLHRRQQQTTGTKATVMAPNELADKQHQTVGKLQPAGGPTANNALNQLQTPVLEQQRGSPFNNHFASSRVLPGPKHITPKTSKSSAIVPQGSLPKQQGQLSKLISTEGAKGRHSSSLHQESQINLKTPLVARKLHLQTHREQAALDENFGTTASLASALPAEVTPGPLPGQKRNCRETGPFHSEPSARKRHLVSAEPFEAAPPARVIPGHSSTPIAEDATGFSSFVLEGDNKRILPPGTPKPKSFEDAYSDFQQLLQGLTDFRERGDTAFLGMNVDFSTAYGETLQDQGNLFMMFTDLYGVRAELDQQIAQYENFLGQFAD